MSFSKQVKDEIMKKNTFKNELELKPFLQGIFMSAGSLIISNKHLLFIISNENEDVINFIRDKIELLCKTENFELDSSDLVICKVVKTFRQKGKFELSIGNKDINREILKLLGVIYTNSDGEMDFSEVLDKYYLKNEETMTAFLTGLFLGLGSISVPNEVDEKRKYGYHFEIVLNSKDKADMVCEVFSHFNIFPKQIERSEQFVVYLKNFDLICDTLSIFGANKIVLDLFNQRVSRDMNNATNRQINCFTANFDKSMTAAANQMIAIDIISKTIGIESLPETLAEAALVRLANPESSLKDLLAALDNKISKGALSQRFKKLIEIANELGENDVK